MVKKKIASEYLESLVSLTYQENFSLVPIICGMVVQPGIVSEGREIRTVYCNPSDWFPLLKINEKLFTVKKKKMNSKDRRCKSLGLRKMLEIEGEGLVL